jgi:four helix bundle suffix protein
MYNEVVKQDFIKEGGVKELMYKARMAHMKKKG